MGRLIEVLALPAGARVLDCPCGQGRHAHLLAEAGYDVDGLDYSPELLEAAVERGTGKTLRYTRGDMRKLPARWTGRFDAVANLFTSFGFFLQASDDRRVIAEFARVLKPGGVLAFADSIQAQDAPDVKRLLEAFPVLFHEPFYGSYQDTDLDALFGAAGLRVQAADTAFMTKALLFEKG